MIRSAPGLPAAPRSISVQLLQPDNECRRLVLAARPNHQESTGQKRECAPSRAGVDLWNIGTCHLPKQRRKRQRTTEPFQTISSCSSFSLNNLLLQLCSPQCLPSLRARSQDSRYLLSFARSLFPTPADNQQRPRQKRNCTSSRSSVDLRRHGSHCKTSNSHKQQSHP